METEPSKADPPKRKCRRFQFSLRTLLVLVLICAIPCAWLARKIQRKRGEREAVEALLKLGGRVGYDYEHPGGKPDGPEWLRSLLGKDFFNAVETVDLWRTKVMDADLENLKPLTLVQSVFLNNTTITDAGLANLEGMTDIQHLWLDGTAVTDAGLVRLIGLTTIKDLNLAGTSVSDSGLKNLKSLTQLRSLGLTHTRVTDAGVKQLQEALPDCKIILRIEPPDPSRK